MHERLYHKLKKNQIKAWQSEFDLERMEYMLFNEISLSVMKSSLAGKAAKEVEKRNDVFTAL